MTDLTERLRKRADEDAKCAENSKVVADLLRPQIEAFEANEDHGNVYAIRMAVDHRDSVKRDGQYAADLREAATTLETLRQENARLREAGWRDIESVPIGKTMFVVIGVTDGNGFTGGQPYTTDPCCVWRNEDGSFARWNHHWPPTHWMPLPPAPARKALGGGDEQ